MSPIISLNSIQTECLSKLVNCSALLLCLIRTLRILVDTLSKELFNFSFVIYKSSKCPQ